jgi:hypothetical protein
MWASLLALAGSTLTMALDSGLAKALAVAPPPFWDTLQVPLGASGRKPNFLLQEIV